MGLPKRISNPSCNINWHTHNTPFSILTLPFSIFTLLSALNNFFLATPRKYFLLPRSWIFRFWLKMLPWLGRSFWGRIQEKNKQRNANELTMMVMGRKRKETLYLTAMMTCLTLMTWANPILHQCLISKISCSISLPTMNLINYWLSILSGLLPFLLH